MSYPEITFKEFSQLAKRRGWTVEMLAELFKEKIGEENLTRYFERVLSCQWLNPATRRMEDRSGVVIPYRSVIEFYLKERRAMEAAKSRPTAKPGFSGAVCACGCGVKVFGKKMYAKPSSRKRAQRGRECHSQNMVTDGVFEG